MASVTYERLFNLGNFNNERISLTDEVRPDETPLGAYLRVRAEVYQMAKQRDPALEFPPPPADDDDEIAF